jgi:hypothetical protein
LECFVDSVPRAKIEEVVRTPDLDRFVTPDACNDYLLEI